MSTIPLVLAGTQAYGATAYDGTYADMYLKQNTFPSGLSEQMVFLDANSSSILPVT